MIPTTGRAPLKACLRALARQQDPPLEVFVVDDRQEQSTRRVVESFTKDFSHIRYLSQRRQGPAAARNRGVWAARGAIVAFVDEDCLVPPGWVRRIKDVLASPHVAAVGGRTSPPQSFWAGVLQHSQDFWFHALSAKRPRNLKESLVQVFFPASRNQLRFVSFLPSNNLACKRAVLLHLGGFDERFRVAAGEDTDLCWRLAQEGYRIQYDARLTACHLHPLSFSKFLKKMRTYGHGLAVLKKKYPDYPFILPTNPWNLLKYVSEPPLYALLMALRAPRLRLVSWPVYALQEYVFRYAVWRASHA